MSLSLDNGSTPKSCIFTGNDVFGAMAEFKGVASGDMRLDKGKADTG